MRPQLASRSRPGPDCASIACHKDCVGVQAEKEAETSRIRMQQLLREREAERDRDAIQNEMYVNKQKALSDAEQYRCQTTSYATP